MSTSASDTTSKPDSGKSETKSSDKNEKSEGSDGGSSHQKNDRASGKDVRGAVNVFMNKSLQSNCRIVLGKKTRFGLMFD